MGLKKCKRWTAGLMTAILTLTLCLTNVLNVQASSEPYVGTVPENGIEAPEGYQATLVVDGKEVQIVPGTTYTEADNAVVVYTNAAGLYGSYEGRGEEQYRTGLYVDGTGVVEEKSVTDAVTGGTYDGKSAEGINIDSASDNFNGLMLVGTEDAPVEYTISNSVFNFLTQSDGSNVSDFTAFGSVLTTFGNAKLTLDNVTINTEGVAKASVVADTGSDILVKNSKVNVAGGTLYDGYVNTADQTKMVAPPWVLGISGNARGTNLLGDYSTTTIYNSDFSASEWGVLSTDACQKVVLTTIDSALKLTGVSGYGTYAIGDAKEYFYGTTFDVATYANIITGGYVTYASSTGTFDIKKDDDAKTTVFEGLEGAGNNSVINSNAFGIMWHGDGEANILDGTEVNTKNAIFLIKNGNVAINVDNSKLNVEDGTILQMIDNDDSTVGVYMPEGAKGPSFNTEFNEAEGYPGINNDVIYDPSAAADDGMGGPGGAPGGEGTPADANAPEGESAPTDANAPEGESSPADATAPAGEGAPAGDAADAPEHNVTASFTNVTLNGNMYNATGYVGAPKTLSVTIGENTELNGIITAASAIHSTDGGATQNTHFTIDEYDKLGHVANKVYNNGDNNVDVVVADGGVWNVTDECEVTSLTVEAGGTLNAVVTVDGSEVEVAQGQTYEGVIKLSAAAAQNGGADDESAAAESTTKAETAAETTPAQTTAAPSAAQGSSVNTPLIIIVVIIVIAVAAAVIYTQSKKKK